MEKPARLNQIIAIEKSIKSRVKAEQTAIYHANEKPQLFEGFKKTYRSLDEAGDKYPPESKLVQFKAIEQVRQVGTRIAELLDVTASKDYANCNAVADVVVDGQVVVSQAPVTFLLFLEKEMTDMRTFLEKLPTLDPADEWHLDVGSSLYKTDPSDSIRTKKVQKPIVLFPATEQHPAQTQLIVEDVTVGNWTTVKLSGAVPEQTRKVLVGKVEKLLKAIKFAREEANNVDAPVVDAGQKLVTWLLE